MVYSRLLLISPSESYDFDVRVPDEGEHFAPLSETATVHACKVDKEAEGARSAILNVGWAPEDD